MLRLCGHSIVNLNDLREYGNFWQIYNQKEIFYRFAEIHCLPITLMLEDGRDAVYLDKKFWLDFLKRLAGNTNMDSKQLSVNEYEECILDRCIARYEEEERKSQFTNVGLDIIPEDVSKWQSYIELAINNLLKSGHSNKIKKEEEEEIRSELSEPFFASEEDKQCVRTEISQLHIVRKIKLILERAKEFEGNCRLVLICLSIHMLTEIDILEFDFENKAIMPKEGVKVKDDTVSHLPIDQQIGKKESVKLSTPMETIGTQALRERSELLNCRKQPYIWLLYESDTLQERSVIQTVKVEAVKSEDAFGNACIQIYSESQQAIVFEFFLRPGEYRHCNITNGKVICFLPTMSISHDRCVYRPHYYSGDLVVKKKDAEEDMRLNYGTDISDMCAGKDGEIYLRKGQILAGRYLLKMKNRRVESILDTVSEEFVEVELVDNGFLLLTNKGKICSNLQEWDGQSVISLYGKKWMRQISEKSRNEIREFNVSVEGDGAILRYIKDDRCQVCWEDGSEIINNFR